MKALQTVNTHQTLRIVLRGYGSCKEQCMVMTQVVVKNPYIRRGVMLFQPENIVVLGGMVSGVY